MSTRTTLAFSAALLCAAALQCGAASAGQTTSPSRIVAPTRTLPVQVARNGADNAPADKAEARGRAADGPRHSRVRDAAPPIMARQGADDGASHEAGEHAAGEHVGGEHQGGEHPGGDDHGGQRGGRG